MILKFIVACHVSTIPKSPPKIIRENTYTGFWESQFFLRRAEARAKRETSTRQQECWFLLLVRAVPFNARRVLRT